MKTISKISLSALLFSISGLPLLAQQLLEESLLHKQLSDGTEVSLYQAMASDPGSIAYYYAPVNLRISDHDGRPEFSFMAYRENNGSIQGGIMHWLLTWGLTASQLQELETWLTAEVDPQAVLMGSIGVTPKGNTRIIPERDPLTQLLQRSMNSSSDIPQVPGSKMAASFQLNADDTQTLQHTMKRPHKLQAISICWDFTFPLWRKTPAGYIALQQSITLKKNLRDLIHP